MVWILVGFVVCFAEEHLDACWTTATRYEESDVLLYSSIEQCTYGGRIRGLGVASQFGSPELEFIVAMCEPVPKREAMMDELRSPVP